MLEYVRLFNSCSHNHMVSHVACLVYVKFVKALLDLRCVDGIEQKRFREVFEEIVGGFSDIYKIPEYQRIWDCFILDCEKEEVKSSGYVVDTLEAVIWCCYQSKSYQEAVLNAVNLGDDTDTVAALTGGIAGVLWNGIPKKWVVKLKKKDVILECVKKKRKDFV